MFNIGGQGQYLVGSIFAVWIGSSFAGMNSFLHILLAIVVATLAGAVWAGIAGLLKATVGAHEVISTIMLNWIAIWVGQFLFGLGGPLQNDTQSSVPISNDIVESAKLHVFWGDPLLQGLLDRHLRRARRARRLLDPAQPDDARVQRQGRRLQPRGGPLRRHQRQPQLLPGDGDLRARSPASPARSTSSAGSSGSRQPTSRRRRSASPASPSRCSDATRRSESACRLCSSAPLINGTSTRNLDPEVFQPELASNLTLLIQGLVVLFVGADVIVLTILRKLRRTREPRAPDATKAAAAG